MASYQPQDSGSPTVLKSRRELLLKQMAEALSTKPVQGGWGEGLARVAQAGLLGWQEGQIDQQERAGIAQAQGFANDMWKPAGASAGVPMADATSPTDAVTQTLAGGAPAPSFAGGQQKMAMPADPDIENRFIGQLKAGGLTNPNGLAAMAAYANAESRYSPKNITGSWADPSESGQAGTSGGILSWRGPRLQAMRNATQGAEDPVTAQAKFALTENPDLTVALQNAKTPEEAHSLMANAWRFAGFDRPGGENDRRLGLTRQYLARVGGDAPQHTAAAAPGMVASAPTNQGVSIDMLPRADGGFVPAPPPRPGGLQVASADPSFAPQMPPGAGLQTPSQVLVAQAQQRAGATPPPTSAVGPAMAQAMPQQPMQGRPQAPANPLDRITQTLAGNPQARAAMQVLQSPWATEGQKVGAKMVLEAATKEPKGPERITVDGTVLEFPVGGGAPRPVYQAPKEQWRAQVDERGNQYQRNERTGKIELIQKGETPEPKILYKDPNTGDEVRGTYDPQTKTFVPILPNASAGPANAPPAPFSPRGQEMAKREDTLRTEFMGQNKTFNTVHDAFGNVVASIQARAADPKAVTPASDMSLVFGYMKMLDPGSVVREGEYATAQNAAGVPDRVLNAYNKALQGEFLSESQRQDFVGQAQRLYGQYRKTTEGNAERYRDLASQYGVNPDRVVALPPPIEVPAFGKPKTDAPTGGADWQEVAPGIRIRPKAGAR